ncbi:MAG: DUF4392 domain-containing protein [Candidatus Tectomicrobia bacterium]|nr:DUF4392 domain-containing protein [Candidatus Tectomicrobia bacterium]
MISNTETIEEIILRRDRRGMTLLKSYLSPNFCEEGAKFIREHQGRIVIATGFYVNGDAETDGPLGAAMLGKALESLGSTVSFVTDLYCAPYLKAILEDSTVLEFPIIDHEESRAFANTLLSEIDPTLVISVERCGFTQDFLYRNMRGRVVSEYTAKLDYLFDHQRPTLGVGDGGNEIGMGNLYDQILGHQLLDSPAVTKTTKLIISSVSNWGAYGLIAALSLLEGRSLLPSFEHEEEMLKRIVDLGAVDGFSGERTYSVDGLSIEENSQILEALHRFLKAREINY